MKTQIKNRVMVLITGPQYEQLVKEGQRTENHNMVPILKLFMENLTWLVTEIDPDGILWGWGDLSVGCVEYGTLCHVDELPRMKGRICYLERDRHWKHKEGADYGKLDSLIGA